MVNDKGWIVLINSKAEEYFGYSRTEVIGKSVEMLVPNRFRAGHPKFRAEFLGDPQARPMGTGRDLFALRKDSSEFPVEIGLAPIETTEGTLVMATVVDITERKRAEEAVRESKERYRVVSELTSDYAYKDRVEQDGRIIPEWFTESFTRITGYSVEETRDPEF